MVIESAPTAGAAALAVLAVAALVWPRSPRLGGAGAGPWAGIARRVRRHVRRRASPRAGRAVPVWAVAAAGGAMACLVVPWSVAVASAMAGATVVVLVRRARHASRERAELSALSGALHALVRELTAGMQPAAAAARVIEDGGPLIAAVLAAAPVSGGAAGASGAREPRGTRVRNAGGAGGAAGGHRAVAERIARAWHLSDRYGVPLAALIGACAADLEDRAALLRLRAGQVAGPAVSGYVLAALPLAGVALGSGMGADPLAVLTGGGIGGVLLVVGVGLCCVGMLWTGRIVHGGGAGDE